MYNLTEYNKKYRKTTGSLWNYYRDEPNSGAQNNTNYSMNDSESFDYKTSITGKLECDNVEKDDVKIVMPLKDLINFGGTLDMPLINFEVSLTLTWSENCLLTSKATINSAVDGINNPTGVTFKIKDTKSYVLVVTLSAENDNKLLEKLKTGFKRTFKWNKYRSG